MEILEWQLVFAASIFGGTLLFAALPLLTLRRSRHAGLGAGSQRALSLLSCVACGVFVAMCFLGLIPQVQSKFASVLRETRVDTDFPVAEAVVVLGFLLVLAVEQLCLLCQRRQQQRRRGGGVNAHHGAADLELREDVDAARQLLDADELLDDQMDDDEVLYELEAQHGNPVGGGKKAAALLRNGSAALPSGSSSSSPLAAHSSSASSCHGGAAALVGRKMGLRFFTLVLALSIHAVFEGLALGLQKEFPRALRLFVAILLHECLCAFALGVNTAKRRLSLCASLKYALLFCLTLPAGLGLGVALGQTPGLVGNVVSGTLQGLAAGIFLHVTFMEIIPAEMGASSAGGDGLLKVLCLFIGFLVISAVNLAQEMQRLFV